MNRDIFIKMLRAFGIVKIEADFDGEGDSGQISFNNSDGLSRPADQILPAEVMDVLRAKLTEPEFDEFRERYREPYHNFKNLEDLIETELYEVLGLTRIDWVNNEGGFGTIEILPFATDDAHPTRLGTIAIEMHERVVTTSDTFHNL